MPETMKRLLIGIAMSATLLGVSTAAAQKIEIATGSDNMKLVEALGAGFEKENPGVDIEVPVGPRSYDDLAQDLLRRATIGEQLPDLVVVGSNQRLFAERGLALPLDTILAKYPNSPLHHATPVVLEKGRILDHTYGVAFGVSLPVVLFNLELVERAGGDPANLPTDWDGILSLAGKINKLGSPVIGGFLEADMSGSMSLLFLLQSHGCGMMSDDESKLTLDTPGSARGAAGRRALRRGRASRRGDVARPGPAGFRCRHGGCAGDDEQPYPAARKGRRGPLRGGGHPLPAHVEGWRRPFGRAHCLNHEQGSGQGSDPRQVPGIRHEPGWRAYRRTESGYFPTNQPAIDASPELQQMLANRSNADAILERLPNARGWFTPPGSQAARIATITSDALLEIVALKKAPKDAAMEMEEQIEPLLP